MRKLLIIIISKIIFIIVIAEDLVIELPNGLIEGKRHSNYISFESIPYAEPPNGNLRFEPPKPFTKRWDGIRNCSKHFHQKCLQFVFENKTVVGSEDCLYLNIFKPNSRKEQLYPVLIYIHGGKYRSLSDDTFGENLIMNEQSMILVTLNYRLGLLGFLSTGDEIIPGNMGLKDQRMAIKWVKDHIRLFNGNPNQILLSGFSTGGSSVHLQLLSEDIQNYVNAAISFSGTALSPWAIDTNPKPKLVKLAQNFNCDLKSSNTIKNCLLKINSQNLVKTEELFYAFLNYPIVVFAPVVEKHSGNNKFLSDYPNKIIETGMVNRIPWMASYAMEEAGGIVANLLKLNTNTQKLYLFDFFEKFDKIAPIMLQYDLPSENITKQFTTQLRSVYHLPYGELSVKNYWHVQEMFTDLLVVKGVLSSVKLYKKYGKSAVYVYTYDYPSAYNTGNLLSNQNDIKFGSVHGDDVFLIFSSKIRNGHPFDENEKIISKNLIKMLENFAKTGKPSYAGKPCPNINGYDDYFSSLMISESPMVIKNHLI